MSYPSNVQKYIVCISLHVIHKHDNTVKCTYSCNAAKCAYTCLRIYIFVRICVHLCVRRMCLCLCVMCVLYVFVYL